MGQNVLDLKNVTKTFSRGNKSRITAAYRLNLSLKAGESIAVVGESGSGKSTLAKLITMIEHPDSGSVVFEGEALGNLSAKELREKRQKMQMVFQQVMAAISPRMKIGDFLKVPLKNFKIVKQSEMDHEVDRLLDMVALPTIYKNKLPHEVSGGELQRVMIARAMAGRPTLLICDEATSALDVAVQEEIIALLIKLQKESGVATLFITHDLSLVDKISQKIVVMYRGRIVEILPSDHIASECRHPYTRLLLSSVFSIDCDQAKKPEIPGEDLEVAVKEEACPFYGRCPIGKESCGNEPVSLEILPGCENHWLACSIIGKKEQWTECGKKR